MSKKIIINNINYCNRCPYLINVYDAYNEIEEGGDGKLVEFYRCKAMGAIILDVSSNRIFNNDEKINVPVWCPLEND